MGSFIVLETTFPSREEGLKMASLLIEHHLCACCQLVPISSCFRYNGVIGSTDEVLLRCKTAKESQKELVEYIVSRHSYVIPEIVVIEASCPYVPYAAWIQDEVCQGGLE